jgi:[ribosomal protein S5]-alanine N-acetyltransferase
MKNISFPLLETERLLLRELSLSDSTEIFLLRSDEKHNQFVDRPLATSMEDANIFINKIKELVSNEQSYFWAIQIKDENNLAGIVSLWNLDIANNKADLGYELLSQHQSKGIMSEAVAAVLKFAFHNRKFSAIQAWPVRENIKSTSLLARLGFTENESTEDNLQAAEDEVCYVLKVENYLYR